MGNLANKNKISYYIQLIGLVFIITSFLLVPSYSLVAQVETNTDTADGSTEEVPATEDTVDSSENASDDNNSTSSKEDSLEFLNDEIDVKRLKIKELRQKADLYEKNIKVKQQETLTLQNQMSIIDLQTLQTENDIVTVKEEIDTTNLEIDRLDIAVSEKIIELDYNKDVLAHYLRLINKYDQKTYLEIFMANESFSEFFDQMRYATDLQSNAEQALVGIKSAKQDLDKQKIEQENKKTELNELADKLESNIVSLSEQKVYKEVLLEETAESEEKFEQMLEIARQEQAAAESEIYSLESKAREKLRDEGVELDISTALMWPVSPIKGISAYFHDPSYPFRYLFEHPAIDIPRSQGTAIRAADNGYVVRAKNAGLGYSYIMIVHSNEISTVYGHISRFDVAEDDYVVRGQQIGAVGGMPGTSGAGRLTTGPHLHFEVRVGGIPVNPLDYLPSI